MVHSDFHVHDPISCYLVDRWIAATVAYEQVEINLHELHSLTTHTDDKGLKLE